jgi:hypothetical protein
MVASTLYTISLRASSSPGWSIFSGQEGRGVSGEGLEAARLAAFSHGVRWSADLL